MKIRFFKSVRFYNDWELNFIGKVWNLRIGRSQVALWKFDRPILQWLKTNEGE